MTPIIDGYRERIRKPILLILFANRPQKLGEARAIAPLALTFTQGEAKLAGVVRMRVALTHVHTTVHSGE